MYINFIHSLHRKKNFFLEEEEGGGGGRSIFSII